MFRPVKVRQYLALMNARGHDAEAVLAGSGVSPAMLEARDFLMELDQARVVVSNMIALGGDPGIGLEVGSQTRLIDLGLVGYAMMSSQSLRQTVQYWINYSNALIGMPTQVRIEEKAPDDWSLVFTEATPLGSIASFCFEEQLVMSYKLGCDLATSTPRLRRLELAYPAPAHHERYRRHFDCPIVFNARHTRISFSAPRLDQPLRGEDHELNELCARQCELVVEKMRLHSPLVAAIKRILSRSQREVPGIEDVARELRISARTLRRHLQGEGCSYQQLVNDFRADQAKRYLRSSLAAKEVSYRLGFNETNSFRRAFKLWTGLTVREYQTAQHQGNRRML